MNGSLLKAIVVIIMYECERGTYECSFPMECWVKGLHV